MNFKNENALDSYLNSLKFIGMGSQGCCYLDNNIVVKIFHDYLDNDFLEISAQEIMKFSAIKNRTYIWPSSTIKLNNLVIGYVSDYAKGKNLYKINPLSINLNNLEKAIVLAHKDIEIISNHGILTYDVMYNILLGKKLYVVDHEEYTYRDDLDNSTLISKNSFNFNYEIYDFLIDSFFNKIVKDNKELSELYKYKNEDVLIFLKLFRKRLNELVGKEITYLDEAKQYRDPKIIEMHYQRII